MRRHDAAIEPTEVGLKKPKPAAWRLWPNPYFEDVIAPCATLPRRRWAKNLEPMGRSSWGDAGA